MIRALLAAAVLAVLALTARVTFSDVGVFAVQKLEARVAEQRAATAALTERNEALLEEVMGLKHRLAAVESRARTDLGMVREGETFFLVVDGD